MVASREDGWVLVKSQKIMVSTLPESMEIGKIAAGKQDGCSKGECSDGARESKFADQVSGSEISCFVFSIFFLLLMIGLCCYHFASLLFTFMGTSS